MTTASQQKGLEALRRSWQSHASRHIGGPPIANEMWAEALSWLAQLARRSDALAQVVREIGMPPLYQTAGEASAHIYRNAFSAMSKPYDDVIGRTGPEAGRPSSHRRDWTPGEFVLVRAYLRRATSMMDCTAHGYGWGLEEDAASAGVTLPVWKI